MLLYLLLIYSIPLVLRLKEIILEILQIKLWKLSIKSDIIYRTLLYNTKFTLKLKLL